MIYVTGDTHGDTDFAKLRIFADKNPQLTKSDYVIIAGDFGAVWSQKTLERSLKPYCALPFTVLFVDGNHENHYLINSYPVSQWHGGKVHIIKPDIIHLMRGQVFELEGKTIFTFGGATSVDKAFRTECVSWWPTEVPSYQELDEGMANLARHGNRVDYIITHSCGLRALMYPPLRSRSFQPGTYPENHMLAYIEDKITWKLWCFGHYHADARLNNNMIALYQDIIALG